MTKIMLVEDDKSLREIYGVRLQAEGYEIKSAGDGEEALAMAIKERPDLILSDVMMPKISGFDMLDIIRSTPETKDIKVIMMTALSSEDQRARGETLGANRYLVKSQVGIEDVVRTVHDLLNDSPSSAPAANAFSAPSQPPAAPTMPQVATPTLTAPPRVAPVQAMPIPVTPEATPITINQAPSVPMPSPTAPIVQTPVEAFTPAPAPAPMPTPFQAPERVIAPMPEVAPMPMPAAEPQIFEQPTIAQPPIQPAPTPNIATMINQELSDNTQNSQTPTQI